ncbi:MAG: hypothetical protein R2860_11345 [Desulfobacterales bacterium]
MKKVATVACGAYMDNGYGCLGEWRCLKAAAMGKALLTNHHPFWPCEMHLSRPPHRIKRRHGH